MIIFWREHQLYFVYMHHVKDCSSWKECTGRRSQIQDYSTVSYGTCNILEQTHEREREREINVKYSVSLATCNKVFLIL